MSLGRVTRPRVLRGVVVGALAATAAGVAGGCGVWQQRPSARFARPYKPTPQGPVQFAPDVDQTEPNGVALDGLPASVQGAFRQEHPDAAVTAVQQVQTGTGVMLYRVAFLEDGTAGRSTYHAGGREMSPAGTGTIIRRDDSGRPRAQYAPSTQPVQAELPVIAPSAAN
jgi:hypothetical protein